MLAFKKKDKNLQPWIPVHEFPTIIIVVVEPLYLQYCKGLPLLTSISENNCSNEESGKKMETFLKHDVTSEWRHIIWGLWLSYHVQYQFSITKTNTLSLGFLYMNHSYIYWIGLPSIIALNKWNSCSNQENREEDKSQAAILNSMICHFPPAFDSHNTFKFWSPLTAKLFPLIIGQALRLSKYKKL